jgi:hypothetical protein
MKRKTILALIFVFAAAVAAFLLPALGPRAQAQQGCTEFRAIAQVSLPPLVPLNPETDTWGGYFYGTLGGQFLSGIFSGNDGDISWQGKTGVGGNGSYTFAFGLNLSDTLTIHVGNFVAPNPPGKIGLGDYRGSAKIVPGTGTGRFQNASGNLDWAGPFIVWSPGGENFYGRYNAGIRGNICGVE